MNELALFAGAGGGILGGLLLGWRTVCAVEFDEHARNVLVARQNDGCLEPFPIWDDVRTFDGKPWRGIVDVVSGGFPCQDISSAGKGAGIDGERSGLWEEMRRIIGEIRPAFAFVENSPMLLVRGIERVLGDLAEMGYDTRWGTIRADHAGLPHGRERIWIISNSVKNRTDWMDPLKKTRSAVVDNKSSNWRACLPLDLHPFMEPINPKTSRRFSRIDDGLAENMDRLERIGNGQIPGVVQKAWHVLCQRIGPKKG